MKNMKNKNKPKSWDLAIQGYQKNPKRWNSRICPPKPNPPHPRPPTSKINFYDYLKLKKVLVLYCVQKGGLFRYSGSPYPITPTTPCSSASDFTEQWVVEYTTPTYITLYWNNDFNNGVVNIQLDEYFAKRWNRSLVCGYAFSDSIVINEIDGIEGEIKVNNVGKISLQRDRDDINALSTRNGLQMGSNFVKIVSVSKRNDDLGCKKCQFP